MLTHFEQDDILLIWKEYISGENWMPSIRQQIVESWTRCEQAGVNPYNHELQSKLDEAALHRTLVKKQELITIAVPFMANLYEFVRGSGFVVVLSDERGYILEMFGDEDMLNNPRTSNFFHGACWREEEAGTNAIGTALVLKRPIQVSGAEHYCQKHHCLTCSAAPILDDCGQIIGILDMSGPFALSHMHTLGMVVAATEAIMAQIDIRRKNRELILANNRSIDILNSLSDGILMIDARGVVNQLNPAAQKIFNKNESDILGMSIDGIFNGKAAAIWRMLNAKESFTDIEIMIETRNSTIHCMASGEPLSDEQGKVSGGVLILRPIKNVKNLVNRFSGYHAALQFSDIIGDSAEIHETIRIASLAATTSSNILLQGESGTGKEIFAQAIHNRSECRKGPFVALNCGVIPRELIGSELFGYVEGAFTGAARGGKPGKFELASGGTLFLDEIGDMPLEQQVALLRVLQEKKLTRIGSDKVIPVDVRVICATNKNLPKEIEQGTFRQDLYYRLNVISITIPPLRNRIKDIPLLFKHFMDKIGRDRSCNFYVESQVLEYLERYAWPGNVRELQNVAERAVSLAEAGEITVAHLPSEVYIAPPFYVLQAGLSLWTNEARDREQRQQLMHKAERQQILTLLSKHGGNISVVAREFGVSRNTLYRKMRLYAIEN
ncbi:sigma-54-dependent Fis family transcriptional regulator [Sporomusa aerivorans]|uniref:sigma-54-dependent Fis family transcriptional regulator n=1 Tax=Sporomusa aerivorans TaxID=204936 RepID=UPI003529F2F9